MLSLSLKTLDGNARAYGQVVYSSLLNLGETMGVEAYAKVLDRQEPKVRQRIRDFLYYPMLRVPKEQRQEAIKAVRGDYPTLFPKDYEFGRDDPIPPLTDGRSSWPRKVKRQTPTIRIEPHDNQMINTQVHDQSPSLNVLRSAMYMRSSSSHGVRDAFYYIVNCAIYHFLVWLMVAYVL